MASDVTTSTPDDLVARVLDEGFLAGDPFPDLARLRAEAPVAHHAETGAWVLSPATPTSSPPPVTRRPSARARASCSWRSGPTTTRRRR